ncbi:glycosyltransferase [Candidatus Poribacteria bacterium]|nr:glycosyltransferase [Candidatus Poribacteria bacterium]MBT5533113.1 glycosyltransferase [Candidatus Poribacteria bacterium]MBT5713148.1 glycosyltransferase [Candidatus Poribacteria bacterium]MBT7097911.1 glycosyltransferase [Candidatus Poribacteria bacterium]MBT7805562.1 glycosyltransferase [Candidatus Poribacteria bacterium]
MKDLLFLNLRFPYPPHRGDRIRAYNLLSGLSRQFRITLITFYEAERELEGVDALREVCHTVKVVRRPRWSGRARAMRNLAGSEPLQNGLWYSPDMQRMVDTTLDVCQPDVAQAQFFRMGQYVAKASVPRLLDLGDALSLNLRRRAGRERNPALRWLTAHEAARAERFEGKIARDFDKVVICSTVDREAIHAANGDLALEIIENGVDLDYYTPSEAQPDSRPPTMLFTGTMDYFPNTDAAYHLAEDVLPCVRARLPDARLLLVGANPPRSVRRLERHAGVVVTGRVPDIRPYFADADVFVSPMRCGSGTQNKNLEAMAMGVPVVTTRLGGYGTRVVEGQDMFCVDGAENVAARAAEIMGDRDLRAAMARNGRQYVEREHGWDVITDKLASLLHSIIPAASDAA